MLSCAFLLYRLGKSESALEAVAERGIGMVPIGRAEFRVRRYDGWVHEERRMTGVEAVADMSANRVENGSGEACSGEASADIMRTVVRTVAAQTAAVPAITVRTVAKRMTPGRLLLPICSVLGVLAAFAVVLAWFPRGEAVWNYPLHQIDAPAHYYFIRKILDEGVGAATHLWPNDAYYPPLFHLLAAGLVKVGELLGLNVSVYAAFNVVWLVGAGLIWPAGMQMFIGYWTRRVDGRTPWRPFSSAMAVLVPLLAVVSPCHPYQMLQSGPLLAYGLATSLLPFWMVATLRLFDAIAARQGIARWMAVTVLTGGLCLFAHPRIAFTWLLFMGPFVLLRLPWKLILAMVGAVAVCAVAFLLYMMSSYQSDRYFDPSSWFHTFVPNRTVPEALRVYVTENLTGVAGAVMAVGVAVAVLVVVLVMVRPRWFAVVSASTMPGGSDDGLGNGRDGGTGNGRDACPGGGSGDGVGTASSGCRSAVRFSERPFTAREVRKDAISLLLAFLLNGLVYVCSTALTGWFPNIVAAAWYRAETRPLTMIPLGVVPLICFAVCMLACVRGGAGGHGNAGAGIGVANVGAGIGTGMSAGAEDVLAIADERTGRNRPRSGRTYSTLPTVIAVALVTALTTTCLFADTTRATMSDSIRANYELSDDQPTEQLTGTKYEILKDVAETVGDEAAVISDPLNGSMYGMAAFGTQMLFPIYNPMAEKNGAIFGQVERAFDSGDGDVLLDTVCPINPEEPEYFLTMGPQAESLQMFTFKEQYDPFHRQDLIDRYVADGTLVKARDYSDAGDYADGWALYRFGCGTAGGR